jgi:hypothetical protein
MINPFQEVEWHPSRKEKRKFARTLLLGFPILALFLLLLGRVKIGQWHANAGPALWVSSVGGSIGLIFYLLPALAGPFYVAWYFAACCVGFVVSNVSLACVFYLVLTPIGLIRRLFKARRVRKTFDRQARTYWRDADQTTDVVHYYRQF